jgi:hypothetical protein
MLSPIKMILPTVQAFVAMLNADAERLERASKARKALAQRIESGGIPSINADSRIPGGLLSLLCYCAASRDSNVPSDGARWWKRLQCQTATEHHAVTDPAVVSAACLALYGRKLSADKPGATAVEPQAAMLAVLGIDSDGKPIKVETRK